MLPHICWVTLVKGRVLNLHTPHFVKVDRQVNIFTFCPRIKIKIEKVNSLVIIWLVNLPACHVGYRPTRHVTKATYTSYVCHVKELDLQTFATNDLGSSL